MWTVNLLMFKLVLEKAEEPEIKLPTGAGSWEKPSCSFEFHVNSMSSIYSWWKIYSLWKILKEIWIPGRTTCLLKNLFAGQEATFRTRHGTMDWFQIGKGVHQGCILSPCLFNLYAEYFMRNARLDKAQAQIKIARRNISNLRYRDDTTLMAES